MICIGGQLHGEDFRTDQHAIQIPRRASIPFEPQAGTSGVVPGLFEDNDEYRATSFAMGMDRVSVLLHTGLDPNEDHVVDLVTATLGSIERATREKAVAQQNITIKSALLADSDIANLMLVIADKAEELGSRDADMIRQKIDRHAKRELRG